VSWPIHSIRERYAWTGCPAKLAKLAVASSWHPPNLSLITAEISPEEKRSLMQLKSEVLTRSRREQPCERGFAPRAGPLMARFPPRCGRGQVGTIRRTLVLWIALAILLAAGLLGWRTATHRQWQRERANWAAETLPRLAPRSATTPKIARELATLKARPDAGGNPELTGEHVLLMTNGEYLIYASRHGAESGFVDHLFLAHGSDDRWYYSTFHFCNTMAMVRAENPPGSIAEFASKYAARQFDGKSDVCLQHTWPVK